MKNSRRIAVLAASAVVTLSGAGVAVAPSADARTRVAQVLEFALDPVTTQLVASDPVRAATDLASAPGVPAVIDGQTWFTVRTLGYMGQSVRESSIRRPCLTGFVELSSNDTSRSAGWSLASCDRVVPQFTRTTQKTEMNPDGSPAGTRSVNLLVP